MTNSEILEGVKHGLGITGDYQDMTLLIHIDEVKAFMASAGVPEDVITSQASLGCILRGVADLWNYGSGSADLSPYFKMRVSQLASGNRGTANV